MRTFNHQRPVRAGDGSIIGQTPSPVQARTVKGLSGQFGPDRGRRLVFTMSAGDVILIRPEDTSREETVSAEAVYAWALRNRALAEARERKARRKAKL